MLDAWNRAQHYRDLAERRLAMTSFSTQMRTSIRRWQYGVLAEAELTASTAPTYRMASLARLRTVLQTVLKGLAPC